MPGSGVPQLPQERNHRLVLGPEILGTDAVPLAHVVMPGSGVPQLPQERNHRSEIEREPRWERQCWCFWSVIVETTAQAGSIHRDANLVERQTLARLYDSSHRCIRVLRDRLILRVGLFESCLHLVAKLHYQLVRRGAGKLWDPKRHFC